ncbi:MAG TPA: DUF6112 family protein [Acidimicrobiales bacterium]|jgi:hypothetical protein
MTSSPLLVLDTFSSAVLRRVPSAPPGGRPRSASLAVVPAPGGSGAGARLTADVVNIHPDLTALPGGPQLQSLMNGLDSWALALALVGLVIGAAAWALGSHGQNYQQSFVGRRAVLISGLAALLIGAGPGIVSFFFTTGSGVH